ncbi:hypothetical protein [Flavobacterium sp.]|uniref:hypothetical protein n=1 Tax=Flavobacterium sp. TaxID=239 RepID=UPI003D28D49D
MNNSFKVFKIICYFLSIRMFLSCGLKPLKSEYILQRSISDPVLIGEFDSGKILIYNGAEFNHKIDNSSTLNVWINNRALGQIKANEYVIIYLLPGKHEFKLIHNDIKKFESIHIVEVDNTTKIISVKPTIISNIVEIKDEIPDNFYMYKNVFN